MHIISFLAQSSNSSGSSVGVLFVALVELALAIVTIAGMWKVFEKAGKPGWASIIPIYNLYIMLKIAGRPGWWLILAFIPFVSFVLIVLPFDIAKRFGKGTGFGLGLLFLFFIFYPLLGFGDAVYTPPGSEARGFPVVMKQ
jgi:uncharacterized membrane protein YhaH (DUF805 family)